VYRWRSSGSCAGLGPSFAVSRLTRASRRSHGSPPPLFLSFPPRWPACGHRLRTSTAMPRRAGRFREENRRSRPCVRKTEKRTGGAEIPVGWRSGAPRYHRQAAAGSLFRRAELGFRSETGPLESADAEFSTASGGSWTLAQPVWRPDYIQAVHLKAKTAW